MLFAFVPRPDDLTYFIIIRLRILGWHRCGYCSYQGVALAGFVV